MVLLAHLDIQAYEQEQKLMDNWRLSSFYFGWMQSCKLSFLSQTQFIYKLYIYIYK